MLLSTVFQTCRPPFLVLTPVCVLLGLSLAVTDEQSVNYFTFFMILLGALSAHMSVNMLNEYYDFKTGLDLATQRTPFSGGSGALPNNPDAANIVLFSGISTLIITAVIGVYFVVTQGAQILPIGLLGLIIVYTYTKWLNRMPLLCLVSPGLGFGVLMVVGTYVVLAHDLTSTVLLVSLIPFFLINNLLLLNQYPDIDADKSIGRKTFPIIYGLQCSNIVYILSAIASFILILILVFIQTLPMFSLIALLPFVCVAYAYKGAITFTSSIGEHSKYLAMNVVAAIFIPLLLSISIFLG